MPQALTATCPACNEQAEFPFFRKRGVYVCSNCEKEFAQAPKPPVEPQTIFLSYAHKSEREEDYDISEELVLLIKAELDKDGHTVWIDKEGIRAGSQWRERITAAILEHAHFLSFLSVRSVRDPGVCLNEIAIALGGHKNIQTVLAEDERRVAAPLTISHLQWHDFQGWREIRAGTRTGPMGEEWDTWFAQRIARLREVIADAQNARIPGELQKLREILEPRTFEARIVEKTKGFSGRRWLFEETRRWLEESTSRMFWLKAGPGIGKSSFAAQLTHQARSAVVGFFMCDFQGKKDPEESAREAICTLAFQLASRLPDYRLKLLYSLQLDKDKILKRTADDLFEYLITEPLNRSGKIPESTRLCLVVDGLDEAGRAEGGNSLAELLAKHAERLPEWLGVLVTSRPEPYLEQTLKPLSSITIDGHSAQNRQDLADWIDARLPQSLEGPERQRVIDAVIDKSGGTFLYLSLVERDRTLDLTKPESLPDQLDGFFKQTFNRYFPDPVEYGKKTEPFLRLMAAAPGPLPAQMGAQILGWGQRELTLNVIEPMGSLLQERDGGLIFFHASLSDWLKDPKRSGGHCLDDGGAKQLGEFVWGQLEGIERSSWKTQVVHWLATLMPHTARWEELEDLERAAAFLQENHRLRDAIAVRKQQLERIDQTVGPQGHLAAQCLRELGDNLVSVGESAQALAAFERERSTYELLLNRDRTSEPFRRGLATACNSLGAVLRSQGQLDTAIELFKRFIADAEALCVERCASDGLDFDVSVAYGNLGMTLESQGYVSEALQMFERSLDIREELSERDPDDPALKLALHTALNRLGGALEGQGLLADALHRYSCALGIARGLVIDHSSNPEWQEALSTSLSRNASVLELQGDLGEALLMLEECRAVVEGLTRQDPDNAIWQRELAAVYGQTGGIFKARGDFPRAMDMFVKYQSCLSQLVAQDPHNALWRQELGTAHIAVGSVYLAEGRTAAAIESFGKAFCVREALSALDPNNAQWRRDLNLSRLRLADAQQSEGDFHQALASYQNGLETSRQLALEDPGNAEWQRDESLLHNRIGGVLKRLGRLDEALEALSQGLAISERLAAMSPDNISAQQDLSIACGQVGSTLMAQGRHEAALEMYLKDIAINEDLTARDPQDATWQSDLAFGLYKAGECCDRLGRHADAALYWRRELQAREVLASLEEDPASSADQLASCHNQVGGALEAAGDQAGALAAFEAYLALSLGVLSADPEDATARRNVAVGQISVARGRMALGDLTAADSLLDAASATFRELLDTEDPGTLIDHAAAVALGAEIAERLGNAEALARRNAELLTIDLPPDGVVGRFRKRFAPLILARLERALADADAHVRAIAVLRALRLAAAALPSIELTPWKRHAREVADVLPAGHDLVERLRRLGN